MNAVEFDTSVLDGKIEIPLRYRDQFSSRIKVILLKEDHGSEKPECEEISEKKAKEDALHLFPELQNFTKDETIAYKESLAKLFKKTGRKIS